MRLVDVDVLREKCRDPVTRAFAREVIDAAKTIDPLRAVRQEGTQVQRIQAADLLVNDLLTEIRTEKPDDYRDLLQEAVYLQTDVNRLVFRLNDMMGRSEK